MTDLEVGAEPGCSNMIGESPNQLLLDTGRAGNEEKELVCIAVMPVEFRTVFGLVGQGDGGLRHLSGIGSEGEGEA